MRRPCGTTTVRRDNRAAVSWAWTGRNLILDEALGGTISEAKGVSVLKVRYLVLYYSCYM